MNTTEFESYFKTPELAQQLLDRLCEQLKGVTIDGEHKVSEVKKNLGGWSVFINQKETRKKKCEAWWFIYKGYE